jgi:uncharacterized protein YjbI with pentapeptide repeats
VIDAKGIAMTEQASGPALPGEEYRVLPHESWSDLEKWVWQEVGSGRTADINAKLGKPADPKKPADWGPERRLSARFLETLLLHDPWRSAIPRQAVRIVGALFDEPVNLVEVEIAHEFWLERSRFTSNVDFHRIRTRSLLSLDGSVFTGTLTMDSASIYGSLLMREGTDFAEVDLRGAKIGGQLDMTGTKVTGMLTMDSANIYGSLLIREGAEFAKVDLRSAKIGGQLDITGAKVTGTLTMESTSIGGALFMREGAEFAEVILRGAKIGGQLTLVRAKVTGMLDMGAASIGGSLLMSEGAEFAEVILGGAKIGGQLALVSANVTGTLDMGSASISDDLFMSGGQFLKPISLVFSKIGGSLDLRGAKVAGLDLTGARIDGELHLASGGWLPIWDDGARMVLRNTRVGAVQDEPNSWPSFLEVDGFLGLGALAIRTLEEGRGWTWFVGWLARDEPYRRGPYHQAATQLREMGHPEMANDVLYARRERERAEAWRSSKRRWLGLSLLNWTVGYGYGHRYFRSLWWVAAFVALGTAVLHLAGMPEELAGSWDRPVFFSLDLLLPIIQLHEPHYTIVLDGFVKYYFAIHKLMGYVLASFLIAGLAGLTK